jgi:hypothetical protein
MPPLQPVTSKQPSSMAAKGLFNSLNSNQRKFQFNTLSLPPAKKEFKREREEKVFITDAEAQKGIAPLEISRGMRSYSCTSEECKHLHFTTFEGPNSVKEHIAIYHRGKM